jgi:molybdopterin-guanine dinucleotide biosynthesis protein A
MGHDKALLEFDGLPLVAHAVRKLERVCQTIAICGNDPALAAWGRLIPDAISGAGPMSALVAATADAQQSGEPALGVVVPVDVPLLPGELLARLAARALESGKWASLIEADGHMQPLCAVYRAVMAEPLRLLLESGEHKVMRAVETVCGASRMECVKLADLYGGKLPLGSEHWFLNVNTPADLEKAAEIWHSSRMP